MSEALDLAIKKCVDAAVEEWRLTYPEYIEMRSRLSMLEFALPSLAKVNGITLDSEIVTQILSSRPQVRSLPRELSLTAFTHGG